jgi:nucleotide-binding universal stress UspA family protein
MRVGAPGKEIKKILVVSAPEWHASHATGFAILVAKRDEASITIFNPYTTDAQTKNAHEYANRLSELCKIHGITNNVKVAKASSLENAIITEARDYDLLVMGSSVGERRKTVDFGRVQDRIAKSLDMPILMVKKVREK